MDAVCSNSHRVALACACAPPTASFPRARTVHTIRRTVKQVLQSRRGLVVVRDVPEPHCPRGSVVVRNALSAISSGTERARFTEPQQSLATRARERPEL